MFDDGNVVRREVGQQQERIWVLDESTATVTTEDETSRLSNVRHLSQGDDDDDEEADNDDGARLDNDSPAATTAVPSAIL